ncbi:MAG: hypothetical protein EZS28_015733 [Streblomastix strix]|uniref:Uncharacterized protein n=1 Tax=Streblomastix strix TaxID=222440 RepID=A0A5J4W1C3_9EUKA|nr:MAG: hypothetical protein EZS28_015733 [Streblomastix strix]
MKPNHGYGQTKRNYGQMQFPNFPSKLKESLNFFFIIVDSQKAIQRLQQRIDSFFIPQYNENRAIAFSQGKKNTSAVIYGPVINDSNIKTDDFIQLLLQKNLNYGLVEILAKQLKLHGGLLKGNVLNQKKKELQAQIKLIINLCLDFIWIDSGVLKNEIGFSFDLNQLNGDITIFNKEFNELTILNDLKRTQRWSIIPEQIDRREIVQFVESLVLRNIARVHLQFNRFSYLYGNGTLTLHNTFASEVFLTLLFKYCNQGFDLEACGVVLKCYQQYRSNDRDRVDRQSNQQKSQHQNQCSKQIDDRWNNRRKCGLQELNERYVKQLNDILQWKYNQHIIQTEQIKGLDPHAKIFESRRFAIQIQSQQYPIEVAIKQQQLDDNTEDQKQNQIENNEREMI